MDIKKVKARLNLLQNKNKKSDLLWKPAPGKQIVRIVPYVHEEENPFIELKFHYNLNGKTYLSPDSFNKPDPIVEFSNKLKKSGDKEEWQFGRKLEPKMRTFCPVIIRGKEKEGVKFWGFGKQVYEAILSYIADPDYGDITDAENGRDIVVEFKTPEETGKSYPETTIRPKPNQTPAVEPELKSVLGDQIDILDLFDIPTYEELKEAMDSWLNAENGETEEVSVSSEKETESTPENGPKVDTSNLEVEETPKEEKKDVAKDNMDSVMSEFDKLFDA